jgi:hypothetical protein
MSPFQPASSLAVGLRAGRIGGLATRIVAGETSICGPMATDCGAGRPRGGVEKALMIPFWLASSLAVGLRAGRIGGLATRIVAGETSICGPMATDCGAGRPRGGRLKRPQCLSPSCTVGFTCPECVPSAKTKRRRTDHDNLLLVSPGWQDMVRGAFQTCLFRDSRPVRTVCATSWQPCSFGVRRRCWPGSFTGVTGWPHGRRVRLFDHGFRSLVRVGVRLSRRWRRVPRAGVVRSWSSGRRCRGQIGIGSVLIACQAVVRSGVQGQSVGRRSQVVRCP